MISEHVSSKWDILETVNFRNTTMFILNLAFADLLYCVTNIPMYSILVRKYAAIFWKIQHFILVSSKFKNMPLQFFHRGWPWSDTTCRMFAVTK